MTTVSIIVFHHGKRICKKFQDDPKGLREFWNKAKVRYRKGGKFFTVKNSVHTPPPKDSENTGEHWCPYCRAYREFPYDSVFEVKRCSVCTVSVNEYWVRKYNEIDQEGEAEWRHKMYRNYYKQRGEAT